MHLDLETTLGSVEIVQVHGDLPPEIHFDSATEGMVGIDTETTGLDWRHERLGLIQVYFPARAEVYLMHPTAQKPTRLLELLESPRWTKVFHYALFDLHFINARWPLHPTNICCTKIASKLLAPSRSRHSLADLVDEHFGVRLDKSPSVRISDWTQEPLTDAQLRYAALDTIYLPELLEQLQSELRANGHGELLAQCFSFIPTQLRANVLGVTDLFGY